MYMYGVCVYKAYKIKKKNKKPRLSRAGAGNKLNLNNKNI